LGLIFEPYQPTQHLTLAVVDALVIGADAGQLGCLNSEQSMQQLVACRSY